MKTCTNTFTMVFRQTDLIGCMSFGMKHLQAKTQKEVRYLKCSLVCSLTLVVLFLLKFARSYAVPTSKCSDWKTWKSTACFCEFTSILHYVLSSAKVTSCCLFTWA